MHTDNTETKKTSAWVLYDADCGFCCRLASRWTPLLHRHGFAFVPLQSAWARERLTADPAGLLSAMALITSTGAIYRGADAIVQIARSIWWARPLHWFSFVPGVKSLLRRGYKRVAERRHCMNGACDVGKSVESKPRNWLKWLPPVGLPAVAMMLTRNLPGWETMWVMAGALFFGAKWIVVLPLLFSQRERIPASRLFAFIFLWPGMDVSPFGAVRKADILRTSEWAAAIGKTIFGGALIWIVARQILPFPMLAGWIGMVGLVFLLHFGFFHFLSLFWRANGIDARPIMRSPVAATSLTEFWGGRWNAAFRDMMQNHFFIPLARRVGAWEAMVGIFLLSGVLHELVISFPARAGYGLPTAYFLIQGIGVLFERSKTGRRIGLGGGWKGWCFVFAVAAIPAFWLFHPMFVQNVILPMLQTIGAT